MATILVRQDGSGQHTKIMSAMAVASAGDIISVGPGTYNENIDFYKSDVQIIGSGKDLTIVQGLIDANVTKTGCTWTLGSTTISIPAGTSGLTAGKIITSTGLAANTRIVSVSATSITVSAATTVAKSNVSITMAGIDAALRLRSTNPSVKSLKLIGIPVLATRAAVETGSIWVRAAGLGATAAINYTIEDCEIVANGESAIICDNTGLGGGTVKNNIFSGQTYVGSQPAQIHAFSSLVLSCQILTSTTIELPVGYASVDVVVGSTILTATNFIQASTTVSAVNGNIVTLNKALLANIGTAQNFTFTNIQFCVPNVARQLIVFQLNNSAPIIFTGNSIVGRTGAGEVRSYNTAVTVDTPNSIVSNNNFDGQFGAGYCLRVRGAGYTVENNTNKSIAPYQNNGYLIGVTGFQTQSMNIGSNVSIEEKLVTSSQVGAGDNIKVQFEKNLLKQNSKVILNPNFDSELEWELVGVVYKHDSSAKRLVSGFRDFAAQKEIKLKASNLSGEKYEFKKMILSNDLHGLLVVYRSEVSGASAYDIVLK
jgi:hypothetical protein